LFEANYEMMAQCLRVSNDNKLTLMNPFYTMMKENFMNSMYSMHNHSEPDGPKDFYSTC